MKKILFAIPLLASLLAIMGSCSSNEDILFDHEQPAFPIQADKILLEAIMPAATSAEEEVYIVGAFNGLDDRTVIGNAEFRLQPSDSVAGKRGIYLDPARFVGGKTLADGYHFVSSAQRNEVSAQGDTVVRHESPAVGTRTNLYVSKWAAYFDPAPTEPKHDGFTVYVDNQTTWGDAITLYMWGDVNDLNGGWPGMKPTGTQVKNGVTYTYFDMGEANTGLTEHLIFSNSGASQLPDVAYTIDHDLYLRVTDSGVEEIGQGGDNNGSGTPTTYKLYIDNQTGWASTALYVWGDTELFGTWPGAQPARTETVGGVAYQVWDIGANGATYHPILNNNGGGNQQDCPTAITATRDYYYKVSAKGWEELTPPAAKRRR